LSGLNKVQWGATWENHPQLSWEGVFVLGGEGERRYRPVDF